MPYVVLKSCFAGGAKRAAGDVIDLSDVEARSLSSMGRVSYAEAKPAKQEVEDRSVGLKVASPVKLSRRAKKTDKE